MIGLGIVGLGRATVTFLSSILAHPEIRVVAAADPSAAKRSQFEADFGRPAVADLTSLCGMRAVDAVYIATPHEMHAAQTCEAAAAGKHIIVEKPMALGLDECVAMIDAAARAGVALVVGPTHGMDPQVVALRKIIAARTYGELRFVSSWNYTDYLYKPRRSEELDTSRGGGIVFNQLPQQVDLVRTIGGVAQPTWVRSVLGAWDPARPTEGACAALLGFADGWSASLVYSGYAHFDSDELCDWVGESGEQKSPTGYGSARRMLGSVPGVEGEALLREKKGYGSAESTRALQTRGGPSAHLPHFGVTIVTCDSADLRIVGDGLVVYAHDAVCRIPVTPGSGGGQKAFALDELVAAADGQSPPVHDGHWGMQTLAVCLAILSSSQRNIEVAVGGILHSGEPT